MLAPKNSLSVCFAHTSYHFRREFLSRDIDIRSFEVRDRDHLAEQIKDADVLVVSSLWDNKLLDKAQKLHFIQCNGAGTEQFDLDQLRSRRVRLASGQGSNSNAVAQHAIAMILSFARSLAEARDNQMRQVWRPMASDRDQREDELGGKTIAIIGFGHVGSRIGELAKAFGMFVIGVKRNLATPRGCADEIVHISNFKSVLNRADFVVLTCPLTKETEKLLDADAFSSMRKTSYLINLSRGKCVDEKSLIDALQRKGIAGAGLDVFSQEPLSSDSPLWGMRNVIMTPHSAGETRRYEENVVNLLIENIEHLWRDETMRNQIL